MSYGRKQRIAFESIEQRLLFAVLNVADFGAHINDGGDDAAAIQETIRAADDGDTIHFEEGTYDLDTHLYIDSGVFLDGSKATLKAQVGEHGWAIKVDADAHDVTIDGFHFDGGGIIAEGNGDYVNLSITNNDFTNPAPGTYWGNGPAIYLGQANAGTVIRNNNFHDYQGYGVIIFSPDRMDLSWNTFENLDQAAHIISIGRDTDVSFNKISGMIRMGFEIQRSGENYAENLTVEGNVLTNWRRPWRDSFGLSIVPDGSTNTRVINNYIQGVPRGWDGEWNDVAHEHHDGKRMGYGIEYGSNTGEVSGNVIGGAFANHIIISGGGGKHDEQIPVEDNQMFGEPMWRDWITKESFGGDGFGVADSNNRTDEDFDAMPAAPAAGADARSESEESDGEDPVQEMPEENDPPRRNPENPPATSEEGDSIDGLVSSYHGTGDYVPDRTPPESDSSGAVTWLSDLRWRSASSGWGPVEIDTNNGNRKAGDGTTLKINGKTYDKGLGAAIDSEIVFRLDGEYDKFLSEIGVDDFAGDEGSVTFEVWVDGHKAYESGLMTGDLPAKAVEVDVRGARELKLVTTDGGDGGRNDHADWGDARLRKDFV